MRQTLLYFSILLLSCGVTSIWAANHTLTISDQSDWNSFMQQSFNEAEDNVVLFFTQDGTIDSEGLKVLGIPVEIRLADGTTTTIEDLNFTFKGPRGAMKITSQQSGSPKLILTDAKITMEGCEMSINSEVIFNSSTITATGGARINIGTDVKLQGTSQIDLDYSTLYIWGYAELDIVNNTKVNAGNGFSIQLEEDASINLRDNTELNMNNGVLKVEKADINISDDAKLIVTGKIDYDFTDFELGKLVIEDCVFYPMQSEKTPVANDIELTGADPYVFILEADWLPGKYLLAKGLSAEKDYSNMKAYKGMQLADPNLYKIEYEAAEKALYIVILTVEQPKKYYTLDLEVAPGIDLYGYSPGEQVMEEGGYLHLQFLPEDAKHTAADILFVIDGVETPFRDMGNGRYYSYILSPIEADHTILIALREYTVKLTPDFPSGSGAWLRPRSGEYQVPYGQPFAFILYYMPREEQDDDLIKVYANGTELPRYDGNNWSEFSSLANSYLRTDPGPAVDPSELYYVIDKVTGPIEITVDGFIPTSNTDIPDPTRMYGTDGRLIIETTMPQAVKIYTVAGTLKAARTVNGQESITLMPGIYLVKTPVRVYKVVVP